MGTLDVMVFEWFNHWAGESRAVMEAADLVDNYAPIAFVSVLTIYFLACRHGKTHARTTILLAGLASLLSLLAVDAITSEIYRPRPFTVLENSGLLIPTFDDSSFPSVHATWSAAIAVVMLRAPEKAIRWVFVSMALLTGLARPVLGDHWPSDVLGSFVIGGVLAQVSVALARPLQPITQLFLGLVQRVEDHLLQ